jgi:hypothetical protein
LLLLEERLEAGRIRPFVDDHDLAVAAVEAMRDDAVRLRPLGDAAEDIRLLRRYLLEPVGIPRDAQRHDD